jgi:esterase
LLDSSHTPEFTYPQLANLALQQLDELKIETCHIAGHSMGGKTAMYLSLHHPDRFASTVVVDSAPVNYVGESWWIVPQMVQAVVSAPLPSPQQHLMTALGDRRLVQFLMTNLNRDRSGWLVDVAAVARDYAQIGSFPDLPAELNSPKPALFVAGGESMHTRRIYDAVIRARFPKAQITRISGAAHWVQVDAPDAFCDSVCRFLDAIDPA